MLPAQWACAAWLSRHQTFQKWLMALIVLLVFSFVTTLLSGFVQTQSAFWKRIDKDGRALENYYIECEPPHARCPPRRPRWG